MKNEKENKKEIERAELHSSIWKIANALRGTIDGWDFKQYVLGMLFYRFISENLTNYVNEYEGDGYYTKASDNEALQLKDEIINSKGFFMLPSELFANVIKKYKDDKKIETLNVELSDIFKNIEASTIGKPSQNNFQGLFADIDVNSNKLGTNAINRNKRLKELMDSIADMKLNYKNNTIDAFGDAYEYLMGMYASNAGKSGGEYFTPQEVSELVARLTLIDNKNVKRVYDPACGSGSLLLKYSKILKNNNTSYYGQEINLTNYNLCRINMILHNIGYDKFSIEHGDTLIDPKHWDDEPFDAIVSNPPYGIKWAGKESPTLINDSRFAPAGVLAPTSKADFAFIMHCLSWLSESGKSAIVCFPGIMYRGGAEQQIRKYLVDNNFIDSIIQLPENLFFGTSISTCIMVLNKAKKDNKILFIDASKEFVKVTNNNKLSQDNINNILDFYKDKKDIEYISKLVDKEIIAQNNYNLTISNYVEKEDTTEIIDINEVNKNIANAITLQNEARAEIDNIIKELES